MRIFVTGTRGIPNILGGVETHCEALFPILQQKGINVTVVRRSAYITPNNQLSEYKGVHLVDIHSPKKKSIEAIVHTFLSVVYAKIKGFKYIHIHAIGPSLIIPFARLLGFKVVMTHHGPDYDRQKWGKAAKFILKAGEWCAAKFANEIIVISNTINDILKDKYNRHDAHLIPNGVHIPELTTSVNYIQYLGLQSGKYIIAVGRFVPEKGFHDLINAFSNISTDYKLVLVGDADHESEYSISLKKKALENNVVLTGFIKGQELNEIFSHTAIFVMPSYHEGLPIALLEALSYNLPVVVSDIPANLEVKIDKNNFFKVGDINDLSEKIMKKIKNPSQMNYSDFLKENYNWDIIADKTLTVYKKLLET